MKVVMFPTDVWTIAGGDQEPCLQLRQQLSTLELCFDASNRHVVLTLQRELTVLRRALGMDESQP